MSIFHQLGRKTLCANSSVHILARCYCAVPSATFPTQPYRLHRLEEKPASEITLKKEEALVLYDRMVRIRRMENASSNLYQAKVIRGFCHLYSGQEAVAVGVYAHLRPDVDKIVSTYRCHAWGFLTYNLNALPVLAELIGVRSGSERGKGGSMHIYNKMMFGGNAVVGATVPLGVGVALAHKYRNNGGVAVALYGDGAANNGQVYESYNIAKLWNLPCLFLCENNLYAMGTSVNRSTPNPDIYTKGDFIPGIQVDGMDIISVWEATRFAMDFITKGKGPILMEARTYRYFGHSMSDPGTTYRSRDEIQHVREKKDPIVTFRRRIIEAKLATEDEVKSIDNAAKDYIDACVKKISSDKVVNVEELTYDIYSSQIIKEVRGVAPYKMWKHKYSEHAFNPE